MQKYIDQGMAVGRDLYPLLDDNQQAMIAFGMFPADIMGLVERQTRERFEQIASDAYDCDVETFRQYTNINPDYVAAVIQGVPLGLMEAARLCGQMIA